MTTRHEPGASLRQQGFTLVEILVALFIGLFLIAGIIQLYLGARQTYRFEEALSRIQENGRYALDTIARDARMAGFSGCTRLENMESATTLPSPIFGVSQASEDDEADTLRTELSATDTADIVTFRSTSANGVPISANTTSTAITLAANPDGFAGGNNLAIADCSNIDIFTADDVTGSGPVTITPDPTLTHTYLAELARQAWVMRFRDVTYFIRPGAGGPSALWRRVLGDEELVEGIEDMQVLYAEDTDGNGSPDLYRPADEVDNWNRVSGLRISLLLVSTEDNLAGEPQPIDWRDERLTPTDTRLRQVFTTTIALRNRLP